MKKKIGFALALIAFLGACAIPGNGSRSANTHVCADKVMRSENTNRPVAGLWSCLTPNLQGKLKTYVQMGLALSADDAIFTDGTQGKPPVVGSQFLGEHNGIQVYSVTLQLSGSLQTFSFTFWVVGGKVDNLGIGVPGVQSPV